MLQLPRPLSPSAKCRASQSTKGFALLLGSNLCPPVQEKGQAVGWGNPASARCTRNRAQRGVFTQHAGSQTKTVGGK